ncbi:MAG: hypothetical protein ACRC20_04110 [Segniliparus sp.]
MTERLEELDLGPFQSLAELREIISKRRGRRIEAMPFPLRGTNISGLFLATPDVDLILYEQDAPLYHQEHIQLHELSHVLLGHVDEREPSSTDVLAQLPQLHGHTVVKVLQRTDYEERIEHEAETMASILAMRLRQRSSTPESEELRRIERSLSLSRRAE